MSVLSLCSHPNDKIFAQGQEDDSVISMTEAENG